MNATIITVDYSTRYGSTWTRITNVCVYDSSNPWYSNSIGRRILGEAAVLSESVERDLGEFTCGDLSFIAENDNGFWSPGSLGGNGPFQTLDPYTSWWSADSAQRPVVLKISRVRDLPDGKFVSETRWEGDIDPKTLSCDLKARTATFTARGPLSRLAGYNAESIRRPIPHHGWTGVVTANGGSGTAWTITDSEANWPVNRYAGAMVYNPDENLYYTIVSNTATRITYTATSQHWSNGDPFIIYALPFRAVGYVGISSGSGAGYLDDSGASWPVNGLIGYMVLDNVGGLYGPVTSNTGTRVSFASGTPVGLNCYCVFDPRRLTLPTPAEGGTPMSVAGLGIVSKDTLALSGRQINGYTTGYPPTSGPVPSALEAQSVEVLMAPLDSNETSTGQGPNLLEDTTKTWVVDEWVDRWLYVVADGAAVKVLSNTTDTLTLDASGATPSAGPYTILEFETPLISPQEVFLIEDMTQPPEVVTCATPYWRDLTLLELAYKITSALGASFNWHGIVTPYLDASGNEITVPYADFTGKNVAEAIASLAWTYNATLCTRYENNVLWYCFHARETGFGAVKDVSDYLCEAELSALWDQSYQAVKVTGADDVAIVRGAPRYGSSILDIDMGYVDNQAFIKAAADRAAGFYGQQRGHGTIKLLGEANASVYEGFTSPAGVYGSTPPGWSIFVGSAADWFSTDNSDGHGVAGQVVLAYRPSVAANSILVNDAVGDVIDHEVLTCDVWASATGEPVGVAFRCASGPLWYAVVVVVDAVAANSYLAIYDEGHATTTGLAHAHVTLQVNKRIRIKVSLKGDTLKAKAWKPDDGQEEPKSWATWNTSPASSSYVGLAARSGKAGVIGHAAGGALSAFDNWAGTRGHLSLMDHVSPFGRPNQDSGTFSATSSSSAEDGSKSWATNQWRGYRFKDVNGDVFGPVLSNTSSLLRWADDGRTPAVGDYTILADDWIVMGIEEQLQEPVPYITLTVVEANGVTYTPDDPDSIDLGVLPQRPEMVSVAAIVGYRYTATWRWEGLRDTLVGFLLQAWQEVPAMWARPESGAILVQAVYAGNSTWTYEINVDTMWNLSPGDPVLIDVTAVLAGEGELRVGKPGYPMRFDTTP